MIIANYISSDRCIIDGREMVGGKSGVLTAVSRQLIAEGADPATLIRAMRDGVQAFAEDKPLSWWAERTVEGGKHRPRMVKYQPHPRSVARAA